jgi:hypothetical protein
MKLEDSITIGTPLKYDQFLYWFLDRIAGSYDLIYPVSPDDQSIEAADKIRIENYFHRSYLVSLPHSRLGTYARGLANPTVDLLIEGYTAFAEDVRDDCIKVVCQLISETDWEVVYKCDLGYPMLEHTKQKTILSYMDYWTEKRLNMLKVPYSIGNIPSK